MATHKSAEKASRQALKRRSRNRSLRSEARGAVGKIRELLDGKGKLKKEEVLPLLKTAESKLRRIATKGALHPKAAARTISRLTTAANKRLNS